MSKNFIFLGVMFVAACGLKLVKDEKYISTEKFRAQAVKICMASDRYKGKPAKSREAVCSLDAQSYIAGAERKFREYKADEHTYRLCRSKFSRIEASDKCFREKQEKYYERELASYREKLKK